MHHEARMRSPVPLRPIALTLSIALGALAACNRIGDQICEEGTDPNDHDDQCPYGPPGGPKVTEDGCPDIPQVSGPECTLSWRNDIWPAMTTFAADNGTVSCSLAGCHGPTTVLKLPDDPEQAYQVLKGYVGQQNYPYLSDKAPAHTWILCNLHGDKGGRAADASGQRACPIRSTRKSCSGRSAASPSTWSRAAEAALLDPVTRDSAACKREGSEMDHPWSP
jgi:hypothetical protein